MKYKRILLKLSGETLSGNDGKGIDFNSVIDICKENETPRSKLRGIFLCDALKPHM